MMTRYAVVLCAALVALGGCDTAQSESGLKVSGKPGQENWPLKGASEGTIICRGWPPTQPASLPIDTPWFIFFKTPAGELFALNGKAQTPVDNGRVQGRNLRAELMAQSADVDRFVAMNKWVNAGVALCKGNRAEAEKLAAETD